MYRSGSSSDFPAIPAGSTHLVDYDINMTNSEFNTIFASLAAPIEDVLEFLPKDFTISNAAIPETPGNGTKPAENAQQIAALTVRPSEQTLQAKLF